MSPKTKAKKIIKEEIKEESASSKSDVLAVSKEKYYESVGRRKNAICRVRLYENGKEINVNNKDYKQYFPLKELQELIESPLKISNLLNKFKIIVKVKGGGFRGQAEAIRHGIARALVKYDANLKKVLKPYGFLKRDPRVKERRKYGLKKARRAPQWSKR